MNKQFYFLSPVEVVKVTSANLEDVAEWCGGSIAETESRRVPGRMDKYVWVPTPKGSNISWAFPGMFITKRLVITMKDEVKETWAVFRRDYFDRNYFDSPKGAVDATWERKAEEAKRPEEIEVVNNVGEAMAKALEDVKASIRRIADRAGVDLDADDQETAVGADLQEAFDSANQIAMEGDEDAVSGLQDANR